MNCQDIENLLPAYIEGDLDTADRARVDAHLETCDGCRESMAFFVELESSLESRRALRPSGAETARQVARRVGLRRSWDFFPALRGLPAMISGGLIALGVILFVLRAPVVRLITGLGDIHLKSGLGRETSALFTSLLGFASQGSVLTWSVIYGGVVAVILLSGSWMVLRFVRE